MGDEKKSGCGLFNAVFRRKNIWPRRSTSTGSLPHSNPSHVTRFPSTPEKNREPDSNRSSNAPVFNPNRKDRKQGDRPVPQQRPCQPVYHHQGRSQQGAGTGRKVPQLGPTISGELESVIADYQKSKGAGNLVRASSGNLMLYGNLGNLRQPGNNNNNNNYNYNYSKGNVSSNVVEPPHPVDGRYSTSVMGNVVRKNEEPGKPEKPVSLCRALSTRMDPEQLKILGNEDYKNGRFAEALALYEAAISIDPNKASYRSNKSAALVALGKLLEAAIECREAIRIDPFYQRAHNRLATIYVRLGEAEKAMYHFKQSGSEADPDCMNKAKQIQFHLNKCTEAKRQRDWNTIIKETGLSIAAGADSAPLIFGLRAEALLRLNRQEEAIETMKKGPDFDIDDCIKFFGPIGSLSLLIFRAQVDLVAGRFDDAVAAAKRASRLDPNNKEANLVLRRTKGVATARTNGNELFKVARYSEAIIAYGEGLSCDLYNAVLLCNRAACRSKLGQYEKAIEDCSAALNVRSGYSKARLRRADCYAKMGKWGACIQDCEVLVRENPDDEEIVKILKEAKTNVGRNGVSQEMINDNAAGMVVISTNERFRDYVTSPGTSVVLFCKKAGDKTMMQLIEQLNHRYPSVNFLKVEVEDHPSLAKSEGVNSFPAFVIYMNGSRAKEIPGENYGLLERSIKYYTNL